ncbi:MAG: ribonuclease P protein component [Pseudomonadota bacterium]
MTDSFSERPLSEPSTPLSRSFSKRKRLLIPSQYKAVFDGARVKASTKHLLLLAIPTELAHSRMGVIVAKKNIRLAVNRNRFKRIIREHFRTQPFSASYDVVVLVRSKQQTYENAKIKQDLVLLWSRFEKNSRAVMNDAHKSST